MGFFFYCNYIGKEEHEGATLNNEPDNSIKASRWLVKCVYEGTQFQSFDKKFFFSNKNV